MSETLLSLPEPFSDVSYCIDLSDAHVSILYLGPPAMLIGAGAIESGMAEVASAKSRPRVDSAGHYFHRETRFLHRSMSFVLRITRHITDPTFAAALPGVDAHTLRFPRLDWLDAHPGRIFVEDEEQTYGGQAWTERRWAGTPEALIAHGFPDNHFHRKWSACTFERYGPIHEDRIRKGSDWIHVGRLMRGYFEVRQSFTNERPPPPTPPRRYQPRAPYLRLVVNNV